MKVLNISNSIHGGAGRAAFRLHKALIKEGINSHFLSMDKFIDAQMEKLNVHTEYKPPSFVTRIKNKLLRLTRIKNLTRRGRLQLDFKALYPKLNCEIASLPFSVYKLSSHPLVKSADVIILHWVAELIDYPDFFLKVNKPVIWTLHDMNPFLGIFHYRNDEKRNLNVAGKLNDAVYSLKCMCINNFKNQIKVVAPSSWLCEKARKSAILQQFPSYFIPNSLDLNVFNILDKDKIKSELNIPDNKIVFLFISETVTNYRKGFDLLLEAMKLLPADKIVLISLGYNTKFVDSEIEIINPGMISEDTQLAKYYNVADAFILPSREDNLPNVMIESFACGVPVIGFPVGGIKEHVKNFETGILASDVSCSALVNALKDFIDIKDKFDAKIIRKYAEENFDAHLQAKKFIELF
ncbi:MAG TPA: glycosyltransferase [Bacteroidia bacterium]|nr:glycosyltransferase [Bacteroidia bacterium]HNU34775.1 glycosyltransferase [Bacteroidia bacterium]